MPRKFKIVDYKVTLDQKISLRKCLPPEHLARFIAKVITELDLSDIYAAYGSRGGTTIAPEASPKLKMAYKLKTDEDQAVYRL